jgi:hypothetical protein
MPLSRKRFQSDQARLREKIRPPRLRAAAFDRRKPLSQRAAALEALFRGDWERAAPRSRGDLALTAESYLRARIVVEHVLAPPPLIAPLTLLAARYA